MKIVTLICICLMSIAPLALAGDFVKGELPESSIDMPPALKGALCREECEKAGETARKECIEGGNVKSICKNYSEMANKSCMTKCTGIKRNIFSF